MAEDGADVRAALARAEATVAEQAAELERLRRRLAEERGAAELREALAVAAAAGTIAAPVSHARLLDLIVETAAAVIGARAGALFLVDEAAGELIFEVAIGPKAAEVERHRVPLGHGIAGLVAVSGQPMAVANADEDSRQAADIARDVGYFPESILCVPLVVRDRVVGVLELLDKAGAASFGEGDMQALGRFAAVAAVAVEQSRAQRDLSGFLGEALGPAAGAVGERARAFAAGLEGDAVNVAEALELAGLVQEIAWQGEAELAACRSILRGFVDYLRQRPDVGSPAGPR